jgi:hypothetical protein
MILGVIVVLRDKTEKVVFIKIDGRNSHSVDFDKEAENHFLWLLQAVLHIMEEVYVCDIKNRSLQKAVIRLKPCELCQENIIVKSASEEKEVIFLGKNVLDSFIVPMCFKIEEELGKQLVEG